MAVGRLVVLIGPPGAGKTTWARAQPGLHLSTDDLRRQLTGRIDGHEADARVAELFDRKVLAAIERRELVLVENGANVRRLAYLAAARAAGLPAEVRLFDDYAVAQARARRRTDPSLTAERWTALAGEARRAAAAVEDEGWDAIVRVRDPLRSSPGFSQPAAADW